MTQKKPHDGISTLLEIMHQLRQPDGCPWDAEQTPESLTPYILEEACELIDVIESGDAEFILDELGDLLLQVVFQSQIFKERNAFDFNDVATAIATKLIRRHPHVFSDNTIRDNVDLDRQWDEIKRTEKSQAKSCLADHLPQRLPALQRAQKLIVKAIRSGRQAAITPVRSGAEEIFSEKELGEELFRLAFEANRAGLDAESVLRKKVMQVIKAMDPDGPL